MTSSQVSNAPESIAPQTEASGKNSTPIDQAKEDSLGNQEAFLQMLIAQIQNQDPLNPTDGTEFLSQLSQFSELEQIIGIREDLKALGTALAQQAEETETAPPTE